VPNFIPLLRSKITDNGGKFRRGQKFRLTPGYRNLINRTFCNGVGGRSSGLQTTVMHTWAYKRNEKVHF